MKYAQKSTDVHNFDRICDLYVASRISCPAEMMAPAIEKPEVHVDFWGTYHSASSTRKHYAEILMCSKTGKSWVIFIQSKNRSKMCSRYACHNWKVNCSAKCKTLKQMEEESSHLSSSKSFARIKILILIMQHLI